MRWNLSRAVWTGGVLLLLAGPAVAEPPSFESRDLARAAAVTPLGGGVRLENVLASDMGEPVAFTLERFEVFAADAEIVVHGEDGEIKLPAPANTYFRGAIEGQPGSRVFLAVLEDGTAQGVVTGADGSYLIGGDDVPAKALGLAPLEMRKIDPSQMKAARNEAFACANDDLPVPAQTLKEMEAFTAPSLPELDLAKAVIPSYTARVAIETDYEFYTIFNNATAATNYIGNLIGYASITYSSEINTSLVVSSVSLWSANNDPWTQSSSACLLMEFGRYWNQNRTNVSRTIAHYMSGKGTGGGIAWEGVLCRGPFMSFFGSSCPSLPAETSGVWGGAYGFTGSLSGGFDINNPTVMWDILAVAHEIGHNFNSPHTHCYAGLEGSQSQIDQCSNRDCNAARPSCYCGTSSLPGSAGTGSGTIMSYCHLTRGSYSDISFNFGTNHTAGVLPGRVATRMRNHVISQAIGNPACLAYVPGPEAIFSNGFEGGTVPGPWSGKTP